MPGRGEGRARLAWAVGLALLLHALGLALLWQAGGPARPVREPPAAVPAMVWVAATPPAPSPARAPQAAAVARPAGRSTGEAPVARPAAPRRAQALEALEPEAPPALVAAPAPSPAGAPPPAPGLEDMARALQRERAWQRRQGQGQALPPQRWEAAPAAGLGAGGTERGMRGADGTRTARVEGAWGSYCVELPSADQPPAMGPAPRIAPPRTCR